MSIGHWTTPGAHPPVDRAPYPEHQGGIPTWAGHASGPDKNGEVTSSELDQVLGHGLVPLRPLQVGEVLAGAVNLIRFNPGATLGASVVAHTCALILALPIGLVVSKAVASGPAQSSMVAPLAVYAAAIPSSFAGLVVTGLISSVAQQAMVGRRPSLTETWRTSGRRSLAFLAFALLGAAAYGAFYVPAMLALWTDRTDALPGLFALLALGSIAVSVLLLRLLPVPALMVLERLGPIRSVKRAWRLTRRRFFATLGTMLLAGILVYFITLAVQTPVTIITLIIGVLVSSQSDAAGTSLVIAAVLSSMIANTVASPYWGGLVSLLYLDARMRNDGLDIDLLDSLSRERAA